MSAPALSPAAWAALVLSTAVACNLPGPSGSAMHLQNGAVRVSDQGGLAGLTPCSEGRGGLDRWCAFFRHKQSATRGQDVWVIDMSRLGRGEDLQCNGPGPGCVLVASGDHVVHAGFVADTLIVDGIPAGSNAVMPTPVVAWRADWEAPALITDLPAASCWTDAVTETVACVEQAAGSAPATDAAVGDGTDAATPASPPGTFRAGRLSKNRRSLVVVPQGREWAQSLPASDRALLVLASGLATLTLATGALTVLPAQATGAVAVTPDERWLLSFLDQKTDPSGTRSLAAAPFPAGSPRQVILSAVSHHLFVVGPRGAGADVVAVASAADGTDHVLLAGPDANGDASSRDLGAWAGTTTGKLEATTGQGYAVVADTQGTRVASLLGTAKSCLLTPGPIAPAQVLPVPALDRLVWIAATVGAAGTGHASALSTCGAHHVFASSATTLQLAGDHQLLFLDAQKHLMLLDLTAVGAAPTSMRDADEVVYQWAYSASDDLLMLEMTSVFDTETRLYVLRHPFATP